MSWLSVTTSIYTFAMIAITRSVMFILAIYIWSFQVHHAQLPNLLWRTFQIGKHRLNPLHPLLLDAWAHPGSAFDVHLETELQNVKFLHGEETSILPPLKCKDFSCSLIFHTDIFARSVTLCSSDLERFKGFRLHNLLPPLSQPRLDLDRGHHCLRRPHHRHHRLLQPDHQEAVPGKLWSVRGVPGHLHHDLLDRRLPLLLVADLHLPERQVEGWGRLQGFLLRPPQQPRQPLPLHLPQCLTQGQGCRDFPVPQNSRDTLQFLFFSKIVFQKPCSYFPHDTQ